MQNVGTADRIVRVITGGSLLVFAVLGLFPGTWAVVLSVVGVLVALTGLSGACPLYRVLRLSGTGRRN